MDLATLRAEIKSWERAFKTGNQRNPTLDDIKSLPKIAAKYKLYKKLSKDPATQTAPQKTNDIVPVTPPRRTSPQPGPSAIVPKSRPIAHQVNDATPNPFSPSKSSRRKTMHPDAPPPPKLNFLNRPSTPPSKRRISSPSPEPPFLPFAAIPEPPSLPVNSAVRKARKRLRGDLVSPSPKKARTGCVRPSPDSNSEDEETACISESPVKAPCNGKIFKPVFEESQLLQPGLSRKKGPFGRNKSMPDPFGGEENGMGSQSVVRGVILPPQSQRRRPEERQDMQVASSVIVGKQAHSAESNLQGKSATAGPSDALETIPTVSGRKRSSSVAADDLGYDDQFVLPGGKLLPPSPPPSTGQPSRRDLPSKGANKDRKKPKLAAVDVNDDDQTDDDSDFQVIELNSQARRRVGSQDNFGDEGGEDATVETFGLLHRDKFDATPEIQGDTSETDEPEINLPENLRSVLHISSSHRPTREEKALVESLLQGRPGPLDQRGEVWSIGEVEDATTTTTDEEWAGEGTPWEVGEL